MIGKPVAILQRREQRGHPHPFHITHDPRQHAPLGVFRVWVNGAEIGRQLSHPCLADCERMLHPPAPREIPPMPRGYTVSTKQRQAAKKPDRFHMLRHASEPDDTTYGRLSDAVALP
jgi:hypothetical protein